MDELRRRFPSVRWEDVRFHEGIPLILRPMPASAMVLPCAWHPRRVHVHLGAHDPATPAGRAVLLHEAVHVQQCQDLGPGLGLLRPFVVAYLAWVPFHGTGRSHPLEVPAYARDGREMAPARFWPLLAGKGRGRWLLPLRLALGGLGALAALVLGPLVEASSFSPRRGAPPP